MVEIKEKQMCCGCQACYNICPKNAITMVEDEYGFKYPKIDKNKCINCGLCNKICPILKNQKVSNIPKAYAVINKDDKVRMNSSSGGIFNLIAKYILSQNGVVFGAAYDANLIVRHIEITTEEEIEKLMCSKYVQSDINDSYRKCKLYLENGKKVLFTGTPCQIEALISFLQKDYENLYTQDIVCHGVPSPKYYEMFLKNLPYNDIKNINFRCKKSSWHNFKTSIELKNKIVVLENNPFMSAFLQNYIIRDSCFDCKFKKKNRLSDITLGDFWGIHKIDKSMDDNKGTSLLVINSKKGEEVFNEIKKNTYYKNFDFENAIKYNSAYIMSSIIPKNRIKFLNKLSVSNFNTVIKKYTKQSIIKKILRKIKTIK